MSPGTGAVVGEDGLARCPWSDASADYRQYHDEEWGRPVRGDGALFERISLEAFQSGLSWLTILRKRPAFREAFAGFDAEQVAAYGSRDVDRLMAERGIVRNHRKIEATITNARALCALWEAGDSLDEIFWRRQPPAGARPSCMEDVPASTPESTALSRELKGRGFVFVGPTTLYAAMQACGVVDDHIARCHVAVRCASAEP